MGTQTDQQGLVNHSTTTLLSKLLASYISSTLLNLPKLPFSGAAPYDEALSSLSFASKFGESYLVFLLILPGEQILQR